MHVIIHEVKVAVVEADMNTFMSFVSPKNSSCMVRNLPLLVVFVLDIRHIPDNTYTEHSERTIN